MMMMMITTSQCFPLLLFNYSEEFWALFFFSPMYVMLLSLSVLVLLLFGYYKLGGGSKIISLHVSVDKYS